MEQRHAHVADVVRAEIHDDPHAVPGHEETALRADHGLGRVGRARREDEAPQRVGPGLDPGVRECDAVERVVEVGTELGGRPARVSGAGRRADEDLGETLRDRLEQRQVPGLGDDEVAVGVLDVAQQVLVAPRVVEPDDRRPCERRPAQREDVVGRVVEEHADVGASRPAGGSTLEEQVREPVALGDVLGVRPHAVREAQRGTIAPLRVVGVRPEQRRRVGRGHRRLTGRGDCSGCGAPRAVTARPLEEHDRDPPVGRLLVLGVRGEELDEARPVLGALGRRRVARADVDLLASLLNLRLGMRLEVQVPGGVRIVARRTTPRRPSHGFDPGRRSEGRRAATSAACRSFARSS